MTIAEQLLDCFIGHDLRLDEKEQQLTHLEDELKNCNNDELRAAMRQMWEQYQSRCRHVENREMSLALHILARLIA